MVGHRIGPERRFGILGHQIPHLHLVPILAVRLFDVHVGEFDGIVLRNVDLDIAAAAELEVLAFGQFHHELLEEGRDIAVRDHGALPLLDAEHGFGNLYLEVLLHLDLASQAPVLLGHLARDETGLGGQDVAAALDHLAFAHAARTAAAAGRRQEDLVVGQRCEQRRAAFGRDDLLAAVDVDRNFTRRGQFGLCKEKQPHEDKGHHQKGNDCNYNSQFHFFRISFKVRTEYPRRS